MLLHEGLQRLLDGHGLALKLLHARKTQPEQLTSLIPSPLRHYRNPYGSPVIPEYQAL